MAVDNPLKLWYTIYRVDLDTFQAKVVRAINSDNPYDAVAHCRKMNGFATRMGFGYAFVYVEEQDESPVGS